MSVCVRACVEFECMDLSAVIFFYCFYYYGYFYEYKLRPLLGERLVYALSYNALLLAPWWLKHFRMRSMYIDEEEEEDIVERCLCVCLCVMCA